MAEVEDDGHMTDFERFGKITASVVAAITRVDPTKSRKWAWRCIRGSEKPVIITPDIQRGLDNEAVAVGSLEIDLGVLCTPGRFVSHPTIPWLGASPDSFLVEAGIAIPVEAKCPRNLHEFVPEKYMEQVQTQIEVCDVPYAYFVSWVEESQRVFKVMRDPDWWARTYPVLKEFYETYVLPDVEPPNSPRRMKEKEPCPDAK